MKRLNRLLQVLTASVLLAAVCVPQLLTPLDPLAQDLDKIFAPAGGSHRLGNDWLGRDVFSRLIHGAWPTLFCAVLVSVTTMITGIVSGALFAFAPKGMLSAYQALLDALIAFPPLLAAILLASVMQPGMAGVVLALYFGSVAQVCRLILAYFREAANAPWVEAAVALGATRARLIRAHIFPALLGPLMILFATQCGNMILAESTLSFLGLGAPDSLSWGSMVHGARQHLFSSIGISLWPASMIALTVWFFQSHSS